MTSMVSAGTVWVQGLPEMDTADSTGCISSGALIELVAANVAPCSDVTVAVRAPSIPVRLNDSGWSRVDAFTSFRWSTLSFELTVDE